MKYITTDKHPEFKERIIFDKRNEALWPDHNEYMLTENHIKTCLEKGYIKEIQEYEFTKDDMIDIIYQAHTLHDEAYMNKVQAKSIFNEWLKQRKS